MFTHSYIVDLAKDVYYMLWDGCNESGFNSYERYKFFKFLGELCEDYEDPEKARVDGSSAFDIGKSELQPFNPGAWEAAE